MIERGRQVAGICLLSLVLVIASSGCGGPRILFPETRSISMLAPDERVVIGQIQYTNGDIRKSLAKNYQRSYPQFSYDLWHVQGPEAAKTGSLSSFGPQGGVFTFKVRRQAVYLDSIEAITGSFWTGFVSWYFPVTLKLPVTNDNCVFVGTIMVSVSGGAPSGPWWPGPAKPTGNVVQATVVDTYERDRAALSAYVEGCDLQKALAEHPAAAEVEALLAKRRAAEEAEMGRREDFDGPRGGNGS